jgi:hypothetical protein
MVSQRTVAFGVSVSEVAFGVPVPALGFAVAARHRKCHHEPQLDPEEKTAQSGKAAQSGHQPKIHVWQTGEQSFENVRNNSSGIRYAVDGRVAEHRSAVWAARK